MKTKYQGLSKDWIKLLRDYNTLLSNHKKLNIVAKEYNKLCNKSNMLICDLYKVKKKTKELQQKMKNTILCRKALESRGTWNIKYKEYEKWSMVQKHHLYAKKEKVHSPKLN